MRAVTFLVLLFYNTAWCQSPAFQTLSTAMGLNDGTVLCFGQDRYGYIWIGTQSGLNRYNGYSVRQYLHVPGDSTSVYAGHLWGMGQGPDGRMYFGSPHGLYRYNYNSDNFTRLKADRPFMAGRMVVLDKKHLLHASSKGLLFHDTETDRLHFFSDDVKDPAQQQLARKGLGEIVQLKNGIVLSTSNAGLLVFDLRKKTVRAVTVPALPSQALSHVRVSKNGTVWLNVNGAAKLVRTDTSFQQFRVYDYLFANRNVLPNAISGILVDRDDRLWVTTGPDGLCLYRPETDDFVSFKSNPFLPSSLAANNLTTVFQDRQGLIWLGSNGYGVNYFNPAKKTFQTLLPRGADATTGDWLWARAAAEDDEGNLWLATFPGVLQYHEKSGRIRQFVNRDNQPPQLHYNSVRGVWCDGDEVWMVTGKGVNCYHRAANRMDFLTEKDSLPTGFYFHVFTDSRGTLWIGGRDDDGLFCREKGKGFVGIRHHPLLKKISGYGVRTVFEDSKQRLWFGLNGSGLARYDEASQTLLHWQRKEGDTTSLTGDLVTGITEDKNGVIWISTDEGIAAFHEAEGQFRQYTRRSGLPSVRTSGIRVDDKNRVWAGSTHGLLVLGADRKEWKKFDETDGLTGAEFSDMPSQKLKDGRFIFPSLKGFVVFDPLHYHEEKKDLPVYLSAFKIFNQPAENEMNVEEWKSVHLGHDQNFFSIELAALNYDSPAATWYAYQLEGFDKDWTYTRNRVINYTNVPGGAYRFRYKASTNAADWKVPEKVLELSVGTVFYKTTLFRTFLLLLTAAMLYSFYRFRMNKQRQILQLETKAKELEKEKTVVQYESLKQHLNPHFLFNSLTSLRSLIRIDQKKAIQFLDGLSKVYRYILKSGEKELILLKDELDFAQTFASLQKTRFGEGLKVNVCIDERYYSRYIAPVTVQNLLENAIKHNTADVESPLHITLSATDGYLHVSNNLQRYHLVESSNGKGLAGLKNLYRYYTDKPVVVTEENQTFTVKIPLL